MCLEEIKLYGGLNSINEGELDIGYRKMHFISSFTPGVSTWATNNL